MKKIIPAIIVAVLVLTGFLYFRSNKNQTTTKATTSKTIPAEIAVENGINDKANVIEGTTALEYLKSRAEIETKGEGANAYVIAISGRKADESKKEFWSFYVNGKMADVGAGSYVLKSRDKIEWKIESY